MNIYDDFTPINENEGGNVGAPDFGSSDASAVTQTETQAANPKEAKARAKQEKKAAKAASKGASGKGAAKGFSLSMEIGGGASKSGKNRYPDKTTINLVMDTGKDKNKAMQIALFVAFMLVLAVFVKFAVIDVLAEGFDQKNKYDEFQAQLTELQNTNANYDAIREEYSHYGNGYLSDEEKSMNDRLAVLRLIDADIMSRSDVQSVILQGNNISLTIGNIRLSTVSAIVQTLEEEEMVSFVTVSTAGTTGDANNSSSMVTATMQIYLNSAGGEE